MKKVITLLFLVNLIAAVAWFNYRVYTKISTTDDYTIAQQYQEPKNDRWVAWQPAQKLFQKNIILDLLLKRL